MFYLGISSVHSSQKLVKEWVEDGGHFLFFEELEPFCQNNLSRIFTMDSEYL
jgi:hypothetical protein